MLSLLMLGDEEEEEERVDVNTQEERRARLYGPDCEYRSIYIVKYDYRCTGAGRYANMYCCDNHGELYTIFISQYA